MKRVKVLYIGGFELPDKNAAAHRVISNAKIIRDLGGEVVFVGINKMVSWDTDIQKTQTNVQGFLAYSVPYPQSKRQWVSYISDIDRYLEILELSDRFDIVIFYNFPSVAMQRLMFYCHSKKIKCIADVTEWYSASGRGFAFLVVKGIDTWFRMRFLHKRMDGLIVISRYLENYYSRHKNVVFIPPLVDTKEQKWKDLCQKHDEETLYLVYAGSPERKDKIDIVIHALKSVRRKYHFNIVGINQDQYTTWFPDDLLFVQNNENITFHGRLSHQQTLNILSSSDYSCLFRDDDRMTKAGFSTKFVEAVSCGTPVLTNNTSNILEFCKDGENAVVLDDISPKSICDALTKITKRMPTNRQLFDYREYREKFSHVIDNLFRTD